MTQEEQTHDKEGYKDVPDAKLERFKMAGVAPLTINELDYDVWWEFRKKAYEEYKGDYGQLMKEMWDEYQSDSHKTNAEQIDKVADLTERVNDLEDIVGKLVSTVKRQGSEKKDEDDKIEMMDGTKVSKN